MEPKKALIPPQCHLCGRWFTSQTSVIRHLNKDHLTTNTCGKWPCSICGKTYTRRNTLKRHTISIHHSVIPVPAPILCTKKTTAKLSYSNNIKTNINPSNVRFRVISAPRPYIFRAKFIPKGRERYYLADGQPNPAISLPRKRRSRHLD